jgi:uncharacterized BrkB/YihY/UPF0761 family membrane protein
MDLLSYVLPEQTESTIGDLVKMTGARGGGLLSIGFLITVCLASAALKGILMSVDTAYGAKKVRAAWITWSIAFGLTNAIGSLCLLIIFLTTFGPALEGFVFRPLPKVVAGNSLRLRGVRNAVCLSAEYSIYDLVVLERSSYPHWSRSKRWACTPRRTIGGSIHNGLLGVVGKSSPSST